jgi:hypothetical protein
MRPDAMSTEATSIGDIGELGSREARRIACKDVSMVAKR